MYEENNETTETQKGNKIKKRQCNTHRQELSDNNSNIPDILRKKWLVELASFVARQTSRLYDNVKYNTKMAPVFDMTTTQTNGRTFRTGKYTNEQYK